MKHQIAILFAAAAVAAMGQSKQPEPVVRPSKSNTANAGKPAVTLPADAVEVSPGLYKHSPAGGPVVMYRKTPFGLVKIDGEASAAAPSSSTSAGAPRENPFGAAGNSVADGMTAVEEGDNIRFERKTPFGSQSWPKKAGDLTADERAAWESARDAARDGKARQAPPKGAAK